MDVSMSNVGLIPDMAVAATVGERLRAVVTDLLLLEPSQVTDDALLVDELGLDSLGFLDLSFTIEERFGVQFPDVKSNLALLSETIPVALSSIETMPGATTLFEFMKAEWARGCRPDANLAEQQAGTLAAAVGGRVPRDIDPSTPIGSIRLHALLRFVTVRTMTRYVEHLVEGARAACH